MPPHLEISTREFLNFSYEDILNLYSLLNTLYQETLEILEDSDLESPSPKFQEELWIEDYNMAQP